MLNMDTLYDKLRDANKTQLKERTLLYPNVGKKVKSILENKNYVIDLTLGDISDMNGMITKNGEWLTSTNAYDFFNTNK